MNRQLLHVLRAVAAVVVLTVLVLTVTRWWREYKDAPSSSATTTQSALPPSASNKEGSTTPAQASKSGKSTDVVVVLINGLNLRKSPDSDAKAIRGLNKGERLTLIKTQGSWYMVKTSEGDEGWTSANPSYSKVEKR